MIDGGNRILPEQHFAGDLAADVTGARAHVAVGQLEPRLGEGEAILLRVLLEALRDLAVLGIELQRQVGREHDRSVPLVRVERIRHQVCRSLGFRHPLGGTCRALRLHPLEGKQVVEVLRRPGNRVGRPGALEAAGDRVATAAAAALVGPAEALLFDSGCRGLDAYAVGRRLGAVGLAERVSAGDQRDGLFVVHRHTPEGLADVLRRKQRVGIAVRAFRVDVNQAHLHGRQRLLQLPVARVALVRQELVLGAPVDEVGLPVVLAATGETEGLEAHRLERDVAGQDHQVGPGEAAAVLLLDRPQEATRLVEVGVVGPAVQRLEALLAAARTAAAISDAVGARAVPGHADEERPVVAVVGGPPVLRGGQHLFDVLLDCVEIELRKRLGVVEVRAKRIGFDAVGAQRAQVELLRPPELVGLRHAAGEGRVGWRCHDEGCRKDGKKGRCSS